MNDNVPRTNPTDGDADGPTPVDVNAEHSSPACAECYRAGWRAGTVEQLQEHLAYLKDLKRRVAEAEAAARAAGESGAVVELPDEHEHEDEDEDDETVQGVSLDEMPDSTTH